MLDSLTMTAVALSASRKGSPVSFVEGVAPGNECTQSLRHRFNRLAPDQATE